jgi:threonine dehydratase
MDLHVPRIRKAMQVIDPVFLNTPQYLCEQLCQALGGSAATVKLETANRVRSFKGRGADLMLSTLGPGSPVVCASSGNFGQAVAYAGRTRGMPVEVFVPETVNPGKRDRMETFGARVIAARADGSSAREAAAAHGRHHPDRFYLQDGRQAVTAEDAGTIGVELTRGAPGGADGSGFAAVMLPVGDGALINGGALDEGARSRHPDRGGQRRRRPLDAGKPERRPRGLHQTRLHLRRRHRGAQPAGALCAAGPRPGGRGSPW